MKKQIFTILLFTVVSLNVLGQFKLDSGPYSLRLQAGSVDRMYIHPTTGKIGMGTNSPDTRLHVDGDENDGTTAALKITSGAQNMILDGNEIDVVGGALYLNYNSSGNVLVGAGGGNVGIGTSGPASKFHVSAGTSGVTPNAQSKYFFEDNSNNYLLIASPDANETGISFGKPSTGANILHSVGGGLSFRTNSNPHMTLTNLGSVGVGTSTPDTKFHVEGTVDNNGTTGVFKVTNGVRSLIFDGDEIDGAFNGPILLNNNSSGGVYIGANGTGLKEIIKVTVNIPAFNVPANGCFGPFVPVLNADLNSTVYISPDVALNGNLMIAYARVSSAGNVGIRVCNVSGAAVAQPAIDYHITVIR
jgi:hypothetical protein